MRSRIYKVLIRCCYPLVIKRVARIDLTFIDWFGGRELHTLRDDSTAQDVINLFEFHADMGNHWHAVAITWK